MSWFWRVKLGPFVYMRRVVRSTGVALPFSLTGLITALYIVLPWQPVTIVLVGIVMYFIILTYLIRRAMR